MVIVLSLSRRRLNKVHEKHRPAGIVPRLFLTQGFQSVCGVLKTVAIGFALMAPVMPHATAQGMRVQEKTITDTWTGAAIGGFDPVAYFVDQRPVQGSVTHLLVQDGVAWHFHSESNLAAFQESPETYRPGFGGYDPVMVASGLPVAGYPHLFAIVEGRLYLFRKPENRALFIENAALRREAQRLWPELQRQLSP
jgi:hypothetical protein